MPVTQTHQALGGFTINLRGGGVSDEFVSRVEPWDHIYVVPKALGPQPNFASLRGASIFTGRIDELDVDSGGVSVSGPSNAVWMGDDQGNGRQLTSTTTASLTLRQWFDSLAFIDLAVNGNFGYSTQQNLQAGTVTWTREAYKTFRQYLGELQDLCDIPFEWYMLPSHFLAIEGFINADLTSTIPAWYPYVAVGDTFDRTEGMSRYSTFDRQLDVFNGDISVSWDFSGFASRAFAIGNNTPPTVRTNAKPNFGETPKGLALANFTWDTAIDAQTDVTGQLDALARTTAQFASVRRQWNVSAGSAEIAFRLKPGDWIWLHAENLPGLGSLTYAQEQSEWAGVDAATDPTTARFPDAAFVNIAGRNVYPVRARVSSMEWPVTDRWHDVYWVSTWNGSGDVTLLNPWMDWDQDGPASIECNASKPKWNLLVPTAETLAGRVRETSANVTASRRRF